MKTINKTKILALILTLMIGTFFMSSCSRDHDEPSSEFTGQWRGKYLGADDRGTWEATVSEKGVFTGTTHSTDSGTNQEITGQIKENGKLEAKTNLGTVFTGNFTASNKVEGSWSFGSSSGTWTGLKL